MKNLSIFFIIIASIFSFSCQSELEEFEIQSEQAYTTTNSFFVSFNSKSKMLCGFGSSGFTLFDCKFTGEGCTSNECSGGDENITRLYTRDINQAIQFANANGDGYVVGKISLDQSTTANKVVLDLLIGTPEVEAYAATLAGTSAFDSYEVSSDYPLPAHVCQAFGVSNLTMKRGTYAITDRTQSGVYFNGKVKIIQ